MNLLDALDEFSWYSEQHRGALLQAAYGACQVAASFAIRNRSASYALLGLGLANVGFAIPKLARNSYEVADGELNFSPVERVILEELAGKENYVQI